MNKDNKVWNIRYVSPETRKRFRRYAKKNKLELAEVLDIASKLL